MRTELTETQRRDQARRIVQGWKAVKTINERADKRLAGNEAMGAMLVFIRRWVQPVVLDLSVGGIIVLEGSRRDEATKEALDAEVRRFLSERGLNRLDVRYHRVIDDNAETMTVYAIEHPHGWTWTEADRQICAQIYGSLRTLDVMVDDIERVCRAELELLRHDDPEACKEVRIFSTDERKERMERIKGFTPEYWYDGPHHAGRYPQMSVEEEEARNAYRRELAVLDQRDRAEERHSRFAGAWENYCLQVRRGRQRDAVVEAEFVRVAGLDAPDMIETIISDIEAWDRETNTGGGDN